MSGGSSAPTTPPATAQPVQSSIAMQQFPAFQPSQQGLLAQQMAQGFGGNANTNEGLLARLYHDVSIPMITRPDQIAQYAKQIGIKDIVGLPVAPATATKKVEPENTMRQGR